MNSKVRGVLLFVVLFVIASSSLFAQLRVFDEGDINVTLENPGTGGATHAVIGSVVKVELTDPDLGMPTEIVSVEANFAGFGGPLNFSMTWDDVANKWKAQYTVMAGSLDGANATVWIRAYNSNGNEQYTQDDLIFTVSNIAAEIGYLDIAATILDPGPTGVAIVGSTVKVTFDDANIVSAIADFSPFGGGMVAMTPAGTVFTASYFVTAGSINAELPVTVYAYVLGNPNPGYAYSNPVLIDNIIPGVTSFITPAPYLSVITRSGNRLSLGESIQVQAKFNPQISKVWIDWAQTFASGTLMEYNVVGGNLIDAMFTPVDGDLAYTPSIEVKIVKLETSSGNVSDPTFVKTVSGDINGDPIVADLQGPVLTANDRDLYFDNNPNTGWLRFSPNSLAVPGYADTTPDHVELKLHFDNWGVPGDLHGFQLRFEAERSVFFRDYEFGSPFITNAGGDLTVSWDGKNDLDEFVANGTYGVTLWKLWDEVGNTTDLSDVYYVADEFPPHANLLDGDGNPQVILNRAHVVVDNHPMEFSRPLTVNGPVEFVREIHVDHFDGDVPFPDQVDDNWTTATNSDFSFRANRDFIVDSNLLRREWGYHWSILTETGGGQWYWKAATSEWVPFVTFDFDIMSKDLVFTSATAQSSQTENFVWNATDFQPPYTEAAGEYERNFTVVTYLKDNAGNYKASDPIDLKTRLSVTEDTYTSNLALVQDIQIISEHVGGPYTLPPYDGSGNHNFYLKAVPYYPVSSDVIEIEVTVNNKDYLKDGNSFMINLNAIGLPTVYKTAADFDANNKVVITITNEWMNAINASKAGAWIIGPDGGMNLPVTVISSVIEPGLVEADYPRTATMDDEFNLVIPPAPVYPTPGTVVAGIDVISPGHASWTYNALLNPANDGILDETDMTINVPAASYPLEWTLRAVNAENATWSRTGTLPAGSALVDRVIPFQGLTNDLQALVDPNSVGEIEVELKVVAIQFADLGYVEVEDQITSTTLTIDNVNPRVVDNAGYTYDHNTRTVSFDTIPVVSNLNNVFEVVLKTNEELRTDLLNVPGTLADPTGGWLASMIDSDGDPLMVGANAVTATVLNVSDLGENTYKIKLQVNGISDPAEALGNLCVLRLPWDAAGNPGRYNDPVYPVASDLFGNDSSEIHFSFNVLNDRPWISKLEFTNHKSAGTIEYNENGDIISQTQGYVGNMVSTGTLKAWVSGLNTRAIVPNYSVDLSALPGASTGSPVHGVELSDKTLTWTLDLNGTVTTGTPYELAMQIESIETGTTAPVYYNTGRSITILGDATDPVANSFYFDNLASNTVQAGMNNDLQFSVSDLPSGIAWDTESITVEFSDPSVSLIGALTFADPLVQGVMTVPTDLAHFTATFTVSDKVNNQFVIVKHLNVLPSPVPSNVVITGNSNAPAFFRPGFDDVTVTWDVSDSQRAESIIVKLWDISVSPNVEVAASAPLAVDARDYLFPVVELAYTHQLKAEVLVNYQAYADADANVTSAFYNNAMSDNSVTADGVDPDGLPIIAAAAGYPEEITIGVQATLTYNVDDDYSGIDYTTGILEFLYDGVLYNTGITTSASTASGTMTWLVDIDNTVDTSRLVSRFTVSDKVGNSSVLDRYLNIKPVPVVSNIQIHDLSIDNADPTNWFVPGHDLEVSFDLDGDLRTDYLTLTLTNSDGQIAQHIFDASEFASSMSHVFPALTGDLDGKMITATIGGYVMYFADPALGGDLVQPLTYDPVDFITINVDTKPVIAMSFHINGDLDEAIDYLLPNLAQMNNLQVKVEVTYPNELSDLVEPVITLDSVYGTILFGSVVDSSVAGDGASRVMTYVYNVIDLDLAYDAVNLYAEAMFHANTHTIYGYHAEEQDHSMVVFGTPVFDQYGITNTDWRSFEEAGRAPNGWFAPEHDLITEYRFVSTLGNATVGVEADFDLITDNVPENWDPPTSLVIDTPDQQPLVFTLTDGRLLTVYPYLAVWETTPDYPSVWNAYVDGEAIQVDYRFKVAPLTPYIHFSMVQVDKEVPTYETSYYEMAVAMGTDAPVYDLISTPVGSDQYRTINLALDPPAPGTWPADKHVYLKLQINDGNGIGAGWVNDPIVDGWTVAVHDSIWVGNTFYKEWKLSPNVTLTNVSELIIQLQQIEDLTGHKNYAGVENTPIHSNLYVAEAPVINIGFVAGSNNGIASMMIAYQRLGGDPLNSETSPYIMPGEYLGFQIELATSRATGVLSIEPVNMQINDPTATDDGNFNWHDLVQTDPANPYIWHLATDLQINPAEDENSFGLRYKITYRITYEDLTTEDKPFVSSWYDTDISGNPLILIDRTAPQFAIDGVVVRSESSVTDNYVVPGEDVNITVLFTDEYGYNNPDTKPEVSITNLNSFIDGAASPYFVAASDINYDSDNGQWKAFVSGLPSLESPGTISEIIVVSLADPVGHETSANKFVEIANQGPIVPLIRDAKYLTQIYDGSWKEAVVEALVDQTVNSKIEVYVDVEFPQYIDEAWITVPDGVNVAIPTEYTIREALPTEMGRWVVVFENVVATDMVAGDITFTANTKRIPYSAEIFEHHRDFTVTVDMMDFMASAPVVLAEAIDGTWINDIISPERDLEITIDIADTGEDFFTSLPADISPWITLESIPAELLNNIQAPVISGAHTATWQINAADIADLGITDAIIKITYQNIYGQIREIEKTIFIDNQAPALANMQLYLDDTMLEDNTDGNFFWDENWDRIRVNFIDLPVANNVGLYDVDVAFSAHPLTYTYNPSEYPNAADALNSMNISDLTVNSDGSGYVDITFSAPYTGTTLAKGRYLISITNLTDLLGASVDLSDQAFDYQYEPAEMTVYVNGLSTDHTANVSEQPIGIIANTSSSLAGLEGVEFRLYYDVDNSGTLTEADLAHDLTSHLDPASDMVFPYDTLWNMTDAAGALYDEYKFIDDPAYVDTAYRGFILRASAITQTRDLYETTTLIKVFDDVAPIAIVDTTPITKTFDYQTHMNTLSVDVDFTDIDVVSVEMAIFNALNVQVDVLTSLVTNPYDTYTLVWDFETFGIGEYTTQVTATDFTGNSSMVDGPAITIINASSTAVANINMFNRIAVNNEQEILDGSIYADNPIDEYLILEAEISNPNSPTNPLNGIAKVGFSALIINRATAEETEISPLFNDDSAQFHNFGIDGFITSNLILVDNGVAKLRFVVKNTDIFPFMTVGADHEFAFRAEFIPETGFDGIDLPEGNRAYTSFIVDQFAPSVVLTNTSTEDPVSWATGHQASFEVVGVNANYDVMPEVATMQLRWSIDGTEWHKVVPNASYNDGIWKVGAWSIEGGGIHRFLGENYEGPVSVKAIATDAQGNIGESNEIVLNVDNKGPETRFTHVIHSVDYPVLTDITGEDEINIVSSSQGTNGSSSLRLFVDAADVDPTAVLPLSVYHMTPDGIWQPAIYDHEAYNLGYATNPNLYEFEIPVNMLVAGEHRFTVVMGDVYGNLEGDIAAIDRVYNYALEDDEKYQATDLVVNVTSIDDVVATITYPANLAYIAGQHALTADTTANDEVEAIDFQHKVNGLWVSIGEVQKASTYAVDFELKRSDLPQYDYLPWVPGVHILSEGTEIAKMLWNTGTQSWTTTLDLTAGNVYDFSYGIDLNNNGSWGGLDPQVNAPNGLEVFTPGLWTLALDTTEYAQGIHEFRAIPIDVNGDELEFYQAPSTMFVIDNVKPIINGISSVGNIQRVQPDTEVDFVTDINGLLVYEDDLVTVEYQFAGQPTGAANRKWYNIASTTAVTGSYLATWTAPNPLMDNVDNNDNGLVDEAAEADGTYYVRAIAHDRAGNYVMSEEFAIYVDGSPAIMQLVQIEDTILANENYIYEIDPALTSVQLKATDARTQAEIDAGFDVAVRAEFSYERINSVQYPFTNYYTLIGEADVVNGEAVIDFEDIQEGYYQFMVKAYDALDNETQTVTIVIFNDVTGPGIDFVQVGDNDVVNGEFAFAQDTATFEGSLSVQLSNSADVNTVTFEYSTTGIDGSWNNITTTSTIPADGLVTVLWNYPNLRAPLLYLRATAQDANANNMISKVVKLYHDQTAPGADVVTLTHTDINGMKVMDQSADLSITLSYTDLNNDGINDVSYIRIRVRDDSDVIRLGQAHSYTDAGMAATDFFFTAAQMAELNDGIYRLEIELVDFAGNASGIIYPADYQTLYIDTTAPANLSIASTSHLDNVAPYDATINFRVNYTDLIGLGDTGALSATFTYQAAEDIITTYTLDAENNWIDFVWNPSTAFEQYILDGEMDIVVNAQVKVTDLLGNEDFVPDTANLFTLIYGVPNTTKIMVVTDYTYDVNGEYTDRIHLVDWNLPTPQVVATLGTNQNENDAEARHALDIYAYLAHQSDVPANGVEFFWYDAVADVWNTLGTDMNGTQWPFEHPGFMDHNQREYSASWDIYGLPTGDYQIKTVSYHLDSVDPAIGTSESIITVHIYNDNIVPNFAVNGALGGQVERGETYTIALDEAPAFNGNGDFAQAVKYMYRYVDPANSNSPISSWMSFGDNEGVFLTDWIQGDYSFDWTVYPYYLYNNDVQVVAIALDQWGTATPLAAVLPNSQYIHINNALAPSVSAISTTWNGIEDPAVISGNVSDTAIVTATINTSTAPEDLVSVEFFHKFTGEADFVSFDIQDGWTVAQMQTDLVVISAPMSIPTAEEVVSGELKVVSTDVYGNTNEAMSTITIENTLPTANFIVTYEGVELTDELERGTTVLLNANPADAPAGVLNVEYFWADADNDWASIDLVEAAPWTLEFMIPEDWEFGATYSLRAVVTDSITTTAGNTLTVDRVFTVTDHSTDIVIDTVAGIAPTTLGIINGRLHGEIPVAFTVNDPAIPSVEFMIRAVGDEDWTPVAFVAVEENVSSIYIYDELSDLLSGEYHFGVRAAAAQREIYPVMADIVTITVDNDIAVTVNSYMPESNGYFNGTDFVVNFTVTSDDEIQEGAVALQYNTTIEPTWMPASVATLESADGINYVATFPEVNVPVDGYYNFRIQVLDSAIPVANVFEMDVAQNVLVDTGLPIVAMVSINDETDLTQTLDIELGTEVAIVASAYDVVGGQIHLIASGIDRVEFLIDGDVVDEAVPTGRSRENYSLVWNTLGYEINTAHTIQAVAYDRAGNIAATATFPINLVAPAEFEAYALITAMDFDYDSSNNDVIYAVVKDWPNTGELPTVTFEYFNGTAWNYFTTAVNQGTYYSAAFNAELMTDITALRAVVNANYDAPMPQLAVSYNGVDHSLVVVNPAISADIFYRNQLRVVESFQDTPIVTALQGGAPVMSTPYMMNGNQVVDIAINAPGIHTFWSAILDDTGNMQLGKTELETVNAGTATDNGISLVVPAGSFAYFQQVSPTIPVPSGFTALSPQHAFFVENNNYEEGRPLINGDLTITITAPAAEGELVAVYYDESTGVWSDLMPVIDNEDGSVSVAGVPSGTVVTVLQYTGVGINVMFSSFNPTHNVGTDTWTTADSEIEFFIYEGMDTNGYIIPASVTSVELYLDNMPVVPTVAFDPLTGIVGYSATDLEAGYHVIRLVVTQNGFTAMAEKPFHVDITDPVITATGSQITSTSRAISANIVDPETGIMDVMLALNTGYYGVSLRTPMIIPMSSMTVNGDIYTYNLTDEDLFTLGYDFSETMEFSASWTAMNHLGMQDESPVEVIYTVNITGPGIVFTGFENGWWINPTQNTPLTFDVIAPQGREIQDNLMIELYELINDPVNGNYDNFIQGMQLNPVSVNGNVYSYSVNFGYSVAPNAHAIGLAVYAEDNYGVQAMSQQTYGIDYLAPVVWALSPVGDAVNPDDFPVTYESAVIPYGTNVAIGIGFQDIQGFVTLETGQWWWDAVAGTWIDDYLVYYTGASGLNIQSVAVTLNGEAITGTVSGGAFTHNAGMLDPGQYTVIATVGDNAGNVGSMSYSFTVTGGAPTVTFDNVDWLNSTQTNALSFTVDSQNTLASGGVVANIYAEPSNMIIQGPITPSPAGNTYSISLLGGIVPAGQFAVRLEVIATDVYGGSSTSNKTYGIDNNAPQITLSTPAENAQFAQNSTVSILASITDQIGAKSAGFNSGRTDRADRAGSGVDSVTLKVIAPDGSTALNMTYGENTQAVSESLPAALCGAYTINLSATDGAGNQSMVSRDFTVVPANAPAVTFNEIPGDWLNPTGINQLGFTIESPVNVNVTANVFVNPANELLMGPLSVSPVEGVYTVSVNGSMIPVDQTSIRLQLMITDQFENVTEANNYYSVDKVAPRISLITPAEDAQFTLNSTVNILANITDQIGAKSAGFTLGGRNDRTDKTGSGISSVTLKVIAPDGSLALDMNEDGNIQVVSESLLTAQYGTYTINLSAVDSAGNQSIVTRNFGVIPASGPAVTFNEVPGGWLNSNGMNMLGFTVESPVNVTVSANVFVNPANELLMGPLTVNPVEGVYTVALNGSMIPVDQTSVRLQVIATDQFANITEANYYYNVDKSAPVITILNPEQGAEITLVNESTKVYIEAQFSDMMPSSESTAGSGIASSRLVVIDPTGVQVGAAVVTGVGITETAHQVDNLMLGTYTVRITVWDNAGNKAMKSVTFGVIDIPVEPAELEITEAHAYPNPFDAETGARFSVHVSCTSSVSVRIYDFAGREVRNLDYSGKTNGKSTIEIVFDGRNNDGTKLARGTYFARVIANDGKKIVEKVVKIAIRK